MPNFQTTRATSAEKFTNFENNKESPMLDNFFWTKNSVKIPFNLNWLFLKNPEIFRHSRLVFGLIEKDSMVSQEQHTCKNQTRLNRKTIIYFKFSQNVRLTLYLKACSIDGPIKNGSFLTFRNGLYSNF